MSKRKLFGIINAIQKDAQSTESFNTGLLGEQMIIASYRKMPTEKLKSMRFIINKIIRERIIQSKKNDKAGNSDMV